MQKAAQRDGGNPGPKRSGKHGSHNENVDEPAKLIDEESAEIEREAPSEGNDPIEGVDDRNSQLPPVFEE